MQDVFCNEDFVLIKFLGSGAFALTYNVYNKKLLQHTAIKIAKQSNGDELEIEINIIKKLTLLNIPNITIYYSDGYCSLLGNKRYYEMNLQDEKIQTFIDNKNVFTKNDLYDIAFELLFTQSYFRKYNFKHRDITTYNILYKINPQLRSYILQSGQLIIISSLIQPIISDYNTSIFQPYNINDPLDFNDILATIYVVSQLYDITIDTNTEDDIVFQQYVDDITENDNLTYEFLQQFLNQNY